MMRSRRLDSLRLLVSCVVVAYLAGLGCNGGGTRPPIAPPSPEQPPPAQPPPSGAPRTIYVSPQGVSTNDGSQASPLDLATALSARDGTPPGSTIWLRGGTYRGAFTSRLNGSAEQPIVVRGAAGERAVLDCASTQGSVLTVLGASTTFQDFEVTCSTPSRVDTGRPGEPNGIYANESRQISLINLVVHDMPGQGLGIWSESMDARVYGTIVYYNGTNRFDHGLYTQNATGAKHIEDNILFGQASHGIHAYGSTEAALDHLHFEGNVVFNNGLLLGEAERNILVGGLRVARDLTVIDNYTYYPPASSRGSNNLGYQAGCANATVTGNYFVGPTALALVNCVPLQLARNVLIGGLEPPDLLAAAPDNQYNASFPRGSRVVVRPNRYQQGRAHVIVYNWELQPQISVDLSTSGLTSGQRFEIRDVYDLFGAPAASGTYTGAPVMLPMTGLRVAQPVWNQAAQPRHTAPEFAVFLVLPR
jgi:hypothetical protein